MRIPSAASPLPRSLSVANVQIEALKQVAGKAYIEEETRRQMDPIIRSQSRNQS